MANPTAPGFVARRAAAETAVLAKITESLAVAGKTPTFSFPTAAQIRKDPVGSYTRLLEGIVTDLGYVDSALDTDASSVASLTADKTSLTTDKTNLTAQRDSAHTAILAQLEAAVLLVVAQMTDKNGLGRLKTMEAAAGNRAAVIAAIDARVTALG